MVGTLFGRQLSVLFSTGKITKPSERENMLELRDVAVNISSVPPPMWIEIVSS